MTQAENKHVNSNKKPSGLNEQNPSLLLILLICHPSWICGLCSPADAHPIGCFFCRSRTGNQGDGVHSECTHQEKSNQGIGSPVQCKPSRDSPELRVAGGYVNRWCREGRMLHLPFGTCHPAEKTNLPRKRIVQSLCSEEIADWDVRGVWTRALPLGVLLKER